MQRRRVAGGHEIGHDRREGDDRVVDDALHLAEAREARAREVRVEDRALGRDHRDAAEDPVVLRHRLVEPVLVEQQRAYREVRTDEQRPLEGHVVARRHLGVRAGQVDRDVVALDDDLRLDPQPHVAVAAVVVEPGRRRDVLAVGQLRDLGAQALLGVVHPVVGRRHADVGPVLLEQAVEAVAAEDAGGHHRVHVAAVHGLRAHVVEDHLVEVLVEDALVVPLEPVVDLGLGVHVEGVGVDARIRAADVEHVGGHGREADQLALPQDRHRDGDVRRVRGAQVGVVVDDHVTLLELLLLDALEEPADVPGQRADVHRRRLRLAQLAPVGVEEARAEVLGLADDRAVAHAEQDARHLLGDGVERAAEHAQRDRVDLDPLALWGAGRDTDFRQISHGNLFLSVSAFRGLLDGLGVGDDEVADGVDLAREARRDDASSSRTA